MISIFLVSLEASSVILIMLILSPFLRRRYSAKWRYYVWLLLAVRLCVPFRIDIPSAPVQIPVESRVLVMPSEVSQMRIVPESEYIEEVNSDSRSMDSFAEDKPLTHISMEKAVFVLWATGAVAFFLFHTAAYAVFKRRIMRYCNRIGKGIYRCERISAPMLIGFFRAKILIPDIDYSQEEIDIIIRHEMTHFNRHDMWYKFLLLAANSLHWFNPLVYVMVSCANRDLEYSCDDAVVRGKGAEYRRFYSKVILKTMERRHKDEIY